jgi:hypothetical protein
LRAGERIRRLMRGCLLAASIPMLVPIMFLPDPLNILAALVWAVISLTLLWRLQ